jgi:methyl acetate hydrolase
MLNDIIKRAVESGAMPFCVAGLANRDRVLWAGSHGMASDTTEASDETLFRIFSMTKAIGSVAALILIDRGKLQMDTPVADVLPAFKDIQVLEAIGPDGPIYRGPRTTCTLRHLLTHTSGFAYETFNAKMMAWSNWRSPDALEMLILNGKLSGFNYPLMFDPGAGFTYGISIDWVGLMVQAIDGRSIDRFCQEEIFDPLGMKNTFFEIDGHRPLLADTSMRTEDGGFAKIELELPSKPEAYGMGHALYSTAPDYLTFLRMVLNGGELNGHRVLSPKAAALMYENQIGDMRVAPMETSLPPVSERVDYFPGVPMTWTGAFLRNEDDVPKRRASGSLTWSGMLNTQYWIDPKSNLAGVLMTQLAPFCDSQFMKAYEAFEEEAYRTY